MKTSHVRTAGFAGFLVLFLLTAPTLVAQIIATNLKCGFLSEPLGVDDPAPRLLWQLQAVNPGQRAQVQTAFQVIVAHSADALAGADGNLWDSGKIVSDSQAVVYRGAALGSEQPVFWKVRVWDGAGRASDWSPVASWTMGLLQPDDWQARWISATTTTNSALPIFRREFVVQPGLTRAVIYICGLGNYELSLNGAKVGDALLAPNWSKYNRTCLYDTYDLTASLTPGTNALGVMLGNGMYNVTHGPRYTKFTGSFGSPKLIARLHLYYSDGTSEVIPTDATWATTAGPITFSSVFGGELHDARLEPAAGTRPASRPWVGRQPLRPTVPVACCAGPRTPRPPSRPSKP